MTSTIMAVAMGLRSHCSSFSKPHVVMARCTVTLTGTCTLRQVRETYSKDADQALLDGFKRLSKADARERRRLGTVATVVTQTRWLLCLPIMSTRMCCSTLLRKKTRCREPCHWVQGISALRAASPHSRCTSSLYVVLPVLMSAFTALSW